MFFVVVGYRRLGVCYCWGDINELTGHRGWCGGSSWRLGHGSWPIFCGGGVGGFVCGCGRKKEWLRSTVYAYTCVRPEVELVIANKVKAQSCQSQGNEGT
jgi:hypothetical protein